MGTNYTNPSTVDVDTVIGEINHAYEARGRMWDDRATWPNVTVKALADEVERLRVRASVLHEVTDVDPDAAYGLNGVWLAYYHDFSGLAVFLTEIEALRHAVENSMHVKFITWGDIGEQIR